MTDSAVLYHSGCPDGWCSAWVAYNALKANGGAVPELVAVSHGQPPPDLTGFSQVFVVDFAYTKDELVDMTDEGRRAVTVLDHHQTAVDSLIGKGRSGGSWSAGNAQAVLDISRSGAGITWDYFSPGHDRPWVVDYVEDRDLWRFELPNSRAVNAFLKAQPFTLGAWDDIHGLLFPSDAAATGRGVLLQIDAYTRHAMDHAYWCVMGGRKFPIVNITYDSCSDVLDAMLDRFEVDMAGYYFRRADGLVQYGFRSRNETTVNDLAEQFGGGGHAPAAGCQTADVAHLRVEP